MDINKLPIYITVGGEVVKIATGTFKEIRAAFASVPGIEVQNVQLDKVEAEYNRRIDQARDAAEGR